MKDKTLMKMLMSLMLNGAGKNMKKSVCVQGNKRKGGIWYDIDCKEVKREARRALHKVQFYKRRVSQSQYDTFVQEYKEKRNNYKSLMKKKKLEFKQKLYQDLINAKGDSAKF